MRRHVRENFGCVEELENLVGCSKVSCSSQAWSARWRWQWYRWYYSGCFVIEIWSDAVKLTDVRVAGFRQI